MKTAAVICELNPFHNGHARIFRKLREEYGADRVIAIMSGNYVQRGEPAVFDKYVRARMALVGDGDVGYADLVLELPVVFATSSAHEFAAAGVRLAAATGVVDMLGFGIEPPATLGTLGELAQRMDEASSMQEASAEDAAPEDASADGAASEIAASKDCGASSRRLRELLASGMTYPAALSEAYGIEGLTPNNILAVEYLRALQALKAEEAAAGRSCSRITPVAITRTGDDYNASEVSNTDYTSASALRTELYAEKAFTYSAVPAALHPLYRELIEGRQVLHPDALSLLLESRILAAAHNLPHANPLSCYLDVSREIADRLMRHADRPMTFTERVADTKTRQYTYSRVSRALLHIAVGITDEQSEELKWQGYVNHIRILGFRREASDLLHALQRSASVPVVTKPADHKDLLEGSIYMDQIYYAAQAQCRRYGCPGEAADTSARSIRSEFERSPLIV